MVLIGLWLEKGKEKEWFSNSEDFRRQKSKATIGWWVLMGGIFAEVLFGFALAAKDEHDIDAAKNAALTAPISTMSATVVLIVMGTEFNDLTNLSSQVARMYLWKDKKTPARLDDLKAENFTRNDFKILFGNPNASNSREYGIWFRSFNFMAFDGIENPVKAINDVKIIRMEINFLPHGVKIAGGGVDLVANNVHKLFQIFPQTDLDSPGVNPSFPGFITATNVLDENK
jgi:hypothetical protein